MPFVCTLRFSVLCFIGFLSVCTSRSLSPVLSLGFFSCCLFAVVHLRCINFALPHFIVIPLNPVCFLMRDTKGVGFRLERRRGGVEGKARVIKIYYGRKFYLITVRGEKLVILMCIMVWMLNAPSGNILKCLISSYWCNFGKL